MQLSSKNETLHMPAKACRSRDGDSLEAGWPEMTHYWSESRCFPQGNPEYPDFAETAETGEVVRGYR